MNTENILGDLSPQEFLNYYWQKKPLLVYNAFSDLQLGFDAEDLAGLATEDNTHSRLIEQQYPKPDWKLRYGPFSDDIYDKLPEKHWTLLVSNCEHYFPRLNKFKDAFSFIPDWRMDDVMVSYAVDGGNVGPHRDEYDVFLIQLQGTREWRIGSEPIRNPETIDGQELSILADFTPEHVEVLKPGDMLYVPPGVGHYGVSRGDCLTASIGFRAPSHKDIVQSYCDHVIKQLSEFKLRYEDKDLKVPQHTGEITNDTIQKVKAILQGSIRIDGNEFARFCGQYLTETSFIESDNVAELDKVDFLNKWSRVPLHKDPATRVAFSQITHNQTELFINGQRYPLMHAAPHECQKLCERRQLNFSEWENTKWLMNIAYSLYRQDAYYFSD